MYFQETEEIPWTMRVQMVSFVSARCIHRKESHGQDTFIVILLSTVWVWAWVRPAQRQLFVPDKNGHMGIDKMSIGSSCLQSRELVIVATANVINVVVAT